MSVECAQALVNSIKKELGITAEGE